jgi:nucleoside-diphosphate-sugar epimerase
MIGRAIFLKRPPHFTRTAVALIGRPTLFSVARARTELGWRPQVPVAEGLRRTLDWYWGLHPELRPETARVGTS